MYKMEQIKQLIKQKFSIFNVNSKKVPVDKNGKALPKWNKLNFDELCEKHDNNSYSWGMPMGQHENGRRVLSLDFDCCGEPDKEGKRVGCEFTKNKLQEYLNGVEKFDGLYTSSTQGNMNVLVDYTDNIEISKLANELGKSKFKYHDLEVLINNGVYQVIPPTATTCKITKELGKPRTNKNNEFLYVLNNDVNFINNFIVGLFPSKLPKNKKVNKSVSIDNYDLSITPDTIIDFDKFKDLLFNYIKNETDKKGNKKINWDDHFQIAGILKSNGFEKKVFIDYTDPIDNTDAASRLWDGININTPMSIYGLQSIARRVNPKDYAKWFKKYNLKKNEDDDKTYCKNDKECAEFILDLLGDKIIFTKEQIFYKIDNIWTNNIDTIESILIVFIMNNSPFYYMGENSRQKWADLKPAQNIVKTIFAIIKQSPDDTVYELFHSTTKGKIAFDDGVLDALTNKFYTWEEMTINEIVYYSTIKINRTFKNYLLNPNLENVQFLEEKVFKPLFGKDYKLGLQYISRALFGHTEDKTWATYTGNRDNGKGVSNEIISWAFGEYVGNFNLKNILIKNGKSMDKETSRDFYWLIDAEFKRLLISQEVPPNIETYSISGELLKKIVSGGDTQVARKCYDRNDTHFKTDASIFIMGNNFINTDSPDCNEHRLQLNSVNQFKTQVQLDELKTQGLPEDVLKRYGLIDTTLKEKCRTEEYCNAFIHLMMCYYTDKPIHITQKYDDDDDNEKPIIYQIYEKLEITGSQDDYALVTDVINLFNIEKKKLNIELTSLGVIKKKSFKLGTKDKYCYFGLKIKKIIQEQG